MNSLYAAFKQQGKNAVACNEDNLSFYKLNIPWLISTKMFARCQHIFVGILIVALWIHRGDLDVHRLEISILKINERKIVDNKNRIFYVYNLKTTTRMMEWWTFTRSKFSLPILSGFLLFLLLLLCKGRHMCVSYVIIL